MSKARGLADLGNVYDDGALSNRNIVVNGACNVAQRGTSKTGLVGQEYATVDRFKTAISSLGTWTASQSTDAPDGFSNSLKYECTTADASPASADFMRIETRLEGQDLQHLAFGTSSAKELTLSFWVKSNKTGDYVSWIYQTDDTRSFSTTYTINTSATWEYKVITIPADTVGVIDNNNDIGLMLFWCLGAGADYTGGSSSSSWGADVAANRYVGQTVNLADTIGNYFQITGVQLEVGDTATPFEHRSFGDELARCQRYYEKSFDYDTAPAQNVASVSGALTTSGVSTSVRTLIGHVDFSVHKRAVPTIIRYNPFASGTGWSQAGALDIASGVYGAGTNGFTMRVEGSPTVTDTNLLINWTADAEL